MQAVYIPTAISVDVGNIFTFIMYTGVGLENGSDGLSKILYPMVWDYVNFSSFCTFLH